MAVSTAGRSGRLSRGRGWAAAAAALALTTVACGSAMSDSALLRANAPGSDVVRPATSPGAPPTGTVDSDAGVITNSPGRDQTAQAPHPGIARPPTAASPLSGVDLPGRAHPATSADGSASPKSAPGPWPPSAGAAAGRSNGTGAAAEPGPLRPGTGTPSGAPIKLGQIATRTGPVGAALQSGLDATRAWVASVNSRGGLAGHPVQLLAVDDRGDPAQALAIARQLVEREHVLALFASLQVTTLQAVLPYVEERHVPIVGTCGCSSTGDGSPMVFEVGATSGKGLVWEHLAGLSLTDKKKVAILYCREAAGCKFQRDGIVGYQRQLGFQVVYEAQVSLAQPDFTAEMIQARQSGAEVVITDVDNASTTRIARNAHRQDYHPDIVTQHGYSEDRALRDAGADAEGILLSTGVAEWSTAPIMADYRDAMNRFVPDGIRGGPGANVWVAGIMLERLARQFPPEPTTADVLEALYALRGETLGGRIPPTAYKPGVGHGDTVVCAVPVRVAAGKFEAPQGPQNFVCAPGWEPVRP